MAELTLDRLVPAGREGDLEKPFEPCARYFSAPDILVYLEEDTPYRADRVDPFLTLLWHPSKDEAIGVKLKGFRFLFERMQAILKSQGKRLDDSDFMSLVVALEIALTAGGAAFTAEAQRQRVEQRYEAARRLLSGKSPRLDVKELALAA